MTGALTKQTGRQEVWGLVRPCHWPAPWDGTSTKVSKTSLFSAVKWGAGT